MPWFGWMFAIMFFTLYVFCIFTVCVMTFQKGRWILGIIGIFLPILWLIGAFLPAKKGSRYELAQEMQYSRQMEQYSA
jgi:hypothetical protein